MVYQMLGFEDELGLLVYGVPDVGGMDYLCMVYQMLGFEDELGLLVYGVPDVGV